MVGAVRSLLPVSASETALHMAVARFLRLALPPQIVFFHCPNGEKRDKATAGKLKVMGVLAGFPDLGFVMPDAQLAVIELKVDANDLSDDQLTVQERLRANRVAYVTARSVEEVERALTRWLAHYGLKLRASVLGRTS